MPAIDNVLDRTPRVQYVAATSQTDFPYPFAIFSDVDLVVDVGGVTKTLATDYTVSGAGDDTGGTITFLSAPGNGAIVTIYRDIAIARTTDFPFGGPMRAAAFNDELDRVTLILQQLEAKIGRSLRFPFNGEATDANTELTPIGNWLSKYVFVNANGVPEPALIVPTTISRSIIGGLLTPQTSAELAAGVAPADEAIVPYARGRYSTFADWRSACDQAGVEGTLDANYTISADIELPAKCDFRGFYIDGAYYTSHDHHQHGWVKNWSALQPRIRGAYFCRYTNIYTGLGGSPGDAGFVEVWGGNGTGNPGTFWNDIHIAYTTKLTLNASNFDINQNLFHSGIARRLRLTGGSGGTGEIHANTFKNLDFTNNGGDPDFGVFQDDTARRLNRLEGCYYENGSDIEGNFDIYGLQADAQAMPKLDRFNHVLGVVGINQKISRDFLSLSVGNLALGGCWDIVDASNKPPCLAHSGGATVSAAADTTEPCGMRRRYEATFADAFDSFQITILPSGSDRFGLVVFYKSTANFVAIESNDGSGAVSHTPGPVTVDSVNNWKMLRIAGAASKTGNTSVTLFAYGASGGANKVMSIGGMFAGAEKAVLVPHRQQTQERFGSATYDPGSLADGVGVTTTVSVTGVATGMFAQACFSNDLQGITLTAWVSAANTVSVRFQNESGGVLDLASGTLRVHVREPFA